MVPSPSASCSPPAAAPSPRTRSPASPFLSFLPASGNRRLLPPPVLQVRMVKPLFPQQRATLGAALGQRVERRQIRALYAAVNVRRFGRPGFPLGWSPDRPAAVIAAWSRVSSSQSQCSCLALLHYRDLIRPCCLMQVSTERVANRSAHDFDAQRPRRPDQPGGAGLACVFHRVLPDCSDPDVQAPRHVGSCAGRERSTNGWNAAAEEHMSGSTDARLIAPGLFVHWRLRYAL